MKKVLSLLAILMLATSLNCYSGITSEELRSPEYLREQGFSEQTIKTIQVEAHEYTPKKLNVFQRVGFKIWNYFDPSSPKANDDIRHDSKPYSWYGDL